MADSELTVESVQKLKVADLKKELKARGLSGTGSKAELAERLIQGMQDTGGEQVLGSDKDTSLEENISLEDHDEDLVLKDDKKEEETEEPPKKKIALIAPVKVTPTPITSPEADKKTEDEKETLSEAERLKKRTERFGAQSDKSKLQMRAERFGVSENKSTEAIKSGKITATEVTTEDLDKLKKRAERFGTNVSTTMNKLEEDERLKKRKERFGAMLTSSAKTGNTVSLSLGGEPDEKKRKRAERFGLQ